MNSWYFVDKILAKDIALKRSPECKVAQILYIPKNLNNIDISNLPENYLFKANHGSGSVVKITDGRIVSESRNVSKKIDNSNGGEVTISWFAKRAKRWTSRIYDWGRQKQYIPIVPRVFFEEYLEDFKEFRCFCFDGKVRFIMIDTVDSGSIKSTLYDRDWKRINATWQDPAGLDVPKPKNLAKIISIVDKLAADIDFVRVDTFVKGADVYFSEFTFTPNGGEGSIKPHEIDMLFSSFWTYDMSEQYELKIPSGIKKLSNKSKMYLAFNIHAKVLTRGAKHFLRKSTNFVE
jgi:hypothetical protein